PGQRRACRVQISCRAEGLIEPVPGGRSTERARRAKKKRKRPIGPGPARTAGQPASKPSGAAAPSGRATATVSGSEAPPVRVQPAEPGGPNRQARKEEARRQREAIRRRQARRRLYRIGVVVLAVLVAAAAITVVAVRSQQSTPNILADAGCG